MVSHGSTLTDFPGNSSVFISCEDRERYRQDFPSYTTCSQLEMAIKLPFLNGRFKMFQRKGMKPLQISKFNNKNPEGNKNCYRVTLKNVHGEGGWGALVPLVWLECRLIQSRN